MIYIGSNSIFIGAFLTFIGICSTVMATIYCCFDSKKVSEQDKPYVAAAKSNENVEAYQDEKKQEKTVEKMPKTLDKPPDNGQYEHIPFEGVQADIDETDSKETGAKGCVQITTQERHPAAKEPKANIMVQKNVNLAKTEKTEPHIISKSHANEAKIVNVDQKPKRISQKQVPPKLVPANDLASQTPSYIEMIHRQHDVEAKNSNEHYEEMSPKTKTAPNLSLPAMEKASSGEQKSYPNVSNRMMRSVSAPEKSTSAVRKIHEKSASQSKKSVQKVHK